MHIYLIGGQDPEIDIVDINDKTNMITSQLLNSFKNCKKLVIIAYQYNVGECHFSLLSLLDVINNSSIQEVVIYFWKQGRSSSSKFKEVTELYRREKFEIIMDGKYDFVKINRN